MRRVLDLENNLEGFIGSFNRKNLVYAVLPKPEKLVDQVQRIFSEIAQHHGTAQSGIIYVLSRRDAEQAAERLRDLGLSAQCYHAGMQDAARSRVHQNWREDRVRVIVATVAFGMGIDKPNVRFVHHLCVPKSMENYLQESGRAGRDGQSSRCVLWYRRQDVLRLTPMVHESNHSALPKLYRFIRQFCESHGRCRRAALADAMGEGQNFDPATDCNGMCDVCTGEAKRTHGGLVRSDMSAYAVHVVNTLGVIHRNGIKSDVSFAQLVEAARSVGPLWKAVAALPVTQADAASLRAYAKSHVRKMPKQEWGRMVMWMILDGILEEAFIANAYSFNSYLVANARTAQKLGTGEKTLVIPVPPAAAKAKVAPPVSGTGTGEAGRKRARGTGGGKHKKKKHRATGRSKASSSSSSAAASSASAAIVVLDSSDDDDDFEDF